MMHARVFEMCDQVPWHTHFTRILALIKKHIHSINIPDCVYISESTNSLSEYAIPSMHALACPYTQMCVCLTHKTPQAHCIHTISPRTSSAFSAASGYAFSSTDTTPSPASLLVALCRGSWPYCARADSRQCQNTTHAVSKHGNQKSRVLLPAAPRSICNVYLVLIACAACVRIVCVWK